MPPGSLCFEAKKHNFALPQLTDHTLHLSHDLGMSCQVVKQPSDGYQTFGSREPLGSRLAVYCCPCFPFAEVRVRLPADEFREGPNSGVLCQLVKVLKGRPARPSPCPDRETVDENFTHGEDIITLGDEISDNKEVFCHADFLTGREPSRRVSERALAHPLHFSAEPNPECKVSTIVHALRDPHHSNSRPSLPE